jgi:hypothetical protein
LQPRKNFVRQLLLLVHRAKCRIGMCFKFSGSWSFILMKICAGLASQTVSIAIIICVVCGIRFDCLSASAYHHSASHFEKPWPMHVIDNSSRGADGVRLADVNKDGLMDIATGWEQGGITRVYLHPGYGNVEKQWPAVTVGQTPAVEDAVFVDLDNDGAVDVVSSCQGSAKKIFIHWAPQGKGCYLDPAGWRSETFCACDGLTQWMFAVATQMDGKNGVDVIAGGKNSGSQIGWLEAPANPRHVADYQWHSISAVGWIMSIILSDMDEDGDLDVVITDRFGRMRGCRWLENPGPGPHQYQQWRNHFIGGKGREVMFAELADLGEDALEDIVVAVRPKSILYISRLDTTGLSWKQREVDLPDSAGTAKAVAVGDIDEDGCKDIVFTCENARGKCGVGWLSYKSDTTGKEWAHHDISGNKRGIKYDRVELLDLDGDRDLDVLTCEENQDGVGLGVIWYENPHR